MANLANEITNSAAEAERPQRLADVESAELIEVLRSRGFLVTAVSEEAARVIASLSGTCGVCDDVPSLAQAPEPTDPGQAQSGKYI